MPTKQMLIDASHPEETRVVVIEGSRLEDYDVEVASRRQLKGNIYLAKVTRVEPSLQACFVDYGGNRHGFLAFNEIHPDYYQIPVADREALIAEQEAAARAAESAADGVIDENGEGADLAVADDEDEFERRRSRPSTRHYKIQEVIKRRQIMLVQVAKEERGNKGAALTTYLSLAGRYCVLMPNTSRGGGISRKITSATDRKRLKSMLSDLDVPEGMAVIVRTAGAGRSKAEIKRDYEYLFRLWSSIRETTLQSIAPSLVYEEGNLIKRSIRDLYDRDIEEIVIQGEPEYRTAKDFMKLFIPSHAKRVKLYEETDKPLFQRYELEEQLDSMHSPIVHLRSGSYIVINPTEALVSIDVNSGRATRERHIEETALRTNLEAAEEISRQLRLRDLAGLVVIDFIDMENAGNQRRVEQRLKEAMKHDRARIQIGRISTFGLLELSRQRLRPSLLETSFETCPHCAGTGLRRTTETLALAALRRIEEEGIRHRSEDITVTSSFAVAMYLLNQKRHALKSIEEQHGMAIRVVPDESFLLPDFRIERGKPAAVAEEESEAPIAALVEDVEEMEVVETAEGGGEREDGAKKGRRRRSRRRRRPEEQREASTDVAAVSDEEVAEGLAEEEAAGDGDEAAEPAADAEGQSDAPRKRRRRGKRGGRRRGRRSEEQGQEVAAEGSDDGFDADDDSEIDLPQADLPGTWPEVYGTWADDGGAITEDSELIGRAHDASPDQAAMAMETVSIADEPSSTIAEERALVVEAESSVTFELPLFAAGGVPPTEDVVAPQDVAESPEADAEPQGEVSGDEGTLTSQASEEVPEVETAEAARPRRRSSSRRRRETVEAAAADDVVSPPVSSDDVTPVEDDAVNVGTESTIESSDMSPVGVPENLSSDQPIDEIVSAEPDRGIEDAVASEPTSSLEEPADIEPAPFATETWEQPFVEPSVEPVAEEEDFRPMQAMGSAAVTEHEGLTIVASFGAVIEREIEGAKSDDSPLEPSNDDNVHNHPGLSSPAGGNSSAGAGPARPLSLLRAESGNRTEVIKVGVPEERESETPPRRGWWQRFVE